MQGRGSTWGRGFTLLEVAVVLAISGIVMSMAVPSYANFLARQQLRAAGEALTLDLRHAREEALRGTPVFVSYREGADWCWGVNRGQPCDCGDPASCKLGRGSVRDYPRVELGTASPVEFEPSMGRATAAAQASFSTSAGHRLQVQTQLMGRSQLCGPDAPKPTNC